MKKITLSILAILVLSTMTISAQTVLIDFGGINTQMAGNWNNLVRSDTPSQNMDTLGTVIDETGASTNFKLKVLDPFDSYNSAGYGTTTPTAGDALANGFTGNASIDSWYVYNGGKGIVRIWGLETNKVYSFTFYSGRTSTDVRTGTLIVSGQNTVKDSLNASGNTSNIKTIANIIPTTQGYIDLTFRASTTNNNASTYYAYLNALKIVGTTPVTTNIKNNNATSLSARLIDNNLVVGDYTGIVKVYTVNGKLVANGQSVFGYMPLSLQKGVYIVETTQGKCKLMVQ